MRNDIRYFDIEFGVDGQRLTSSRISTPRSIAAERKALSITGQNLLVRHYIIINRGNLSYIYSGLQTQMVTCFIIIFIVIININIIVID